VQLAHKQVEQYRADGFLFPLDLFDPGQVEAIHADFREAREDARRLGLDAEWPMLLRANAHYLMPFVHRTACAKDLLDAVESLLGPDLLLYSAEFFIKPAHSNKIVSWHQDLTYWGLGETDDELTAWVALSEVNVESGCMRFIPGSHRQPILQHRDTFSTDNLLSRGQEVAVDVNESEAVDVLLHPGQVSLHHGHLFHASGLNSSPNDRVGLVFRYVTPAVRQQVSQRDYATLVRGRDQLDNWVHVAPPKRNFAAEDLTEYERIRAEQRTALAADAEQALHAAY
jgi:ectoine hydroxylase-related dioxygenase (phytanoyl-CoA dioxygenase family)